MNNDHPTVCPRRIARLGLITAVFVIACGLPDSVDVIARVVRTLVTG